MNRGILFQPDMVRQILAGKKKQTRRMVKAPLSYIVTLPDGTYGDEEGELKPFSCPYGQVADTLTVREAWRAWKEYDDLPPRDIRGQTLVHFEADGPAPEIFGRYRHARFMPLHMARFKLQLTSVRVELPQDISEADAIEEGFTSRAEFLARFAEINGTGNPWCWVLSWA